MVDFIFLFALTVAVSCVVGSFYGWAIGRMERRSLRRKVTSLESEVNTLKVLNRGLPKKTNVDSKNALIG